jgi:hypothetical protein
MVAILACPAVAAAGNPALHEETLSGPVWSLMAGAWVPVPDVQVTLTCVQTRASRRSEILMECESELVLRRAGKILATQTHGIPGYSFRAAGGNNGSVGLELFRLGEAAFVRVVASEQEGDMQMRRKTTSLLFAVEGAGLRPIYEITDVDAFDPGPDSSRGSRLTLHEIAPGEERTGGIPNILVHRREDSQRSEPVTSVVIWNGRTYTTCATCKPVPAKPRVEPPPPPVIVVADPTLIDPATGKSFEPILALALAGKPIDPASLEALSVDTLVRLRNAPYARHGRPFKMAALQAFFYDPRPGPKSLLPLTVNPSFAESMLDAVDRANVQAVIAEQKRRGK